MNKSLMLINGSHQLIEMKCLKDLLNGVRSYYLFLDYSLWLGVYLFWFAFTSKPPLSLLCFYFRPLTIWHFHFSGVFSNGWKCSSEHPSKTSLFQETEGENLLRE